MGTIDIPLDKAELLSMVLEALLYGFSLFMFGGTIWALLSQRSTLRVNHKMLVAACSLLLFSTAVRLSHLAIDILRIMEGLLYRNSYPGESIAYFADVSHWTFVSKNYVYAAQTLIGDGVVIYRCYAVWQYKPAMVLPALLWCAVGGKLTGFACPYTESRLNGGDVFDGRLSRWVISFWVSTLTTNAVTTLMLAYRIWYVDRNTTTLCDNRKSELRPILYVIIDAGMIYSLTMVTALICFVNGSNSQYVVLGMITPVISITFYMVIVRVGMAHRAHQQTNPSVGNVSGHVFSRERINKGNVDIMEMEMNGDRIDNSQPSSVGPSSPIRGNDHRIELQFDDIELA
ncbi:hypothetical protein HD554DRAFT_2013575 [Boletus coccyginus]|nr:hypothetical protein HD554DRAFT_2013575 [Boletus coccyginus]